MRASELARPPIRPGNLPTFANSVTALGQSGGTRFAQGSGQAGATEQHHPPDHFTIYELFVASITALISVFMVRDCDAVALNYRTFISRPVVPLDTDDTGFDRFTDLHWLTSVNVHWTSSGTVLLSTFTVRTQDLCCLSDVTTEEQLEHVGRCIRVAPNGSLASISGFEDTSDSTIDDSSKRVQRKRTKTDTIQQSVEKWKGTVKRWLSWRGYSLPNLDQRSSWVRIRHSRLTPILTTSPGIASSPNRDLLWPKALCFLYRNEPFKISTTPLDDHLFLRNSDNDLRWFKTSGSMGFKDPMDIAQEWFSGKQDREKVLEARRRLKKAEGEATRRKEEPSGLYPSSPLNARGGTYGDLQAVSGVYPTPPDGVAPGPAVSSSDTPSVSGAISNVILVPAGTHPAINLSAPQDHPPTEEDQNPSTSPLFPTNSDHTSGFDDDLFEDMEEEETGAHRVNEADFDFFDGPDEVDVDMADTATLSPTKREVVTQHDEKSDSVVAHEPYVKEEVSDPLTALENALASASHAAETVPLKVKSEHTESVPAPALIDPPVLAITQQVIPQEDNKYPVSKESTPPLSPGLVAKALQPSPPLMSAPRKPEINPSVQLDSTYNPLDFSRRMSLVDAKYQDGRFATQHNIDAEEDNKQGKPQHPQPKSLRNLPLLTNLRYAIGVASASRIPQVESSVRASSVDSDLSSEASELSETESDEETPTGPLSFVGRLIIPAKRKLPTENNGTPLSVTSIAESFGGDWQDLHGLQLDEAYLASFEPTSWDWSLVNYPSPAERTVTGARFAMPSLPAPNAQLPDTPTSQPDMNMELPDEQPLSGRDSIAITQIVTDQIISASLDVLGEDEYANRDLATGASVETRWQIVVKTLFPKATECTLPALAAVYDVFPDFAAQAKIQPRPPPRKPNEGTAIPANHMYHLNPPFVRVRRAETHWDLLPPSIAFWEPLGLAPVSPSKSVVAFCIYPHSDSLRPHLETFLLGLQLAFDSCKLGSHARVELGKEYESGLVPWKVASPSSQRDAFTELKNVCIQFGKLLAMQLGQIREQQDTKIDAFVIYMIDPFSDPSSLWELCSAFWALFQAYGQGPPGRSDAHQKPDLVLQIIPIKHIASFESPVILDSSTYINLAREVYERCPPSAPSTDKTPLSIYSAPAFQLEESLPRSIPFKLISEPPQDLLRENSYMHVGYATSLDGTWITAAWTDNCGKSQAVVSYHLGTRMFGDIAKEIWQTTVEILQSRRVHWRVCIAKAGVMDREELENWVLLITCPTQLNLFLTLLTVDTEPPYKFTPAISTTSSTTAQGATNTPVTTPQAGVSPDPTVGLTPAATPSADTAADPASDPEARLIDITDETWGITLAHHLHNSNSTNQFSPALISGLLVKRGETHLTSNSTHRPIPDPLPGPIVVAVNILWIGAVGSTRAATSPFPPAADGVSPGGYAASASAPQSPTQERSTSSLMWTPTVQTRTTAENLLKEVLVQFRALGLLAKLKGMRGTRHGSVPWHVVAAQRGVKGLSRVMGGM
jgi:mediator of RNA polymerase II transcription subunit 13